jgi:hypothetical protein
MSRGRVGHGLYIRVDFISLATEVVSGGFAYIANGASVSFKHLVPIMARVQGGDSPNLISFLFSFFLEL